jgi:hypothetical protein
MHMAWHAVHDNFRGGYIRGLNGWLGSWAVLFTFTWMDGLYVYSF